MDDAWRQLCRTSAISERDQRGQASREKEQANVLAASDAQVSITSSCFSPPAFRESGSSSIVIHICVLQPLQEREEISKGKKVERSRKSVARLLSSAASSVLSGSSLPLAAIRTQGWEGWDGACIHDQSGDKQAVSTLLIQKRVTGTRGSLTLPGYTGEDKERLPHEHQHYGSLLLKDILEIRNDSSVPLDTCGGYPHMYLHQEIILFLKNILSVILLTLPFILFTAVTVFLWTLFYPQGSCQAQALLTSHGKGPICK